MLVFGELALGREGFVIKKKRFSVEQIVALLTKAELGMAVADLIRHIEFSERRFFAGRSSTRGRSRTGYRSSSSSGRERRA